MAEAAREMPPMEPENNDEEVIEVTDDMIIEEVDESEEDRGMKMSDLADVGKFNKKVEDKRELREKLSENLEKAKADREELPDNADDAIADVLAMHEEDVEKEVEAKEMADWEAKQAEQQVEAVKKEAEAAKKAEDQAARDASREAFKQEMHEKAIAASDKADELRLQIKEDAETLETEEAAFFGKGREMRGETNVDQDLRDELKTLTQADAVLEKEWKDARDQLATMKVDMDKPRGLFGRIGLGMKKMFNADLRKAHNIYASKVKAWEDNQARMEELKAHLNIDEGPGATMLHKSKSRRDDDLPKGSASIRGENL